MKRMVHVDSFTGTAASLRRGKRSPDNVLAALKENPRVSTWDMSEHSWLRGAIALLIKDNRITEDKTEVYPWHRYNVMEQP